MNLFLTPTEIKELTGYTRKNEQAKSLAASGYDFDVRKKDGNVLVLRSYIERKFGVKVATKQEKIYQPNVEGLRKHCG